MQTCGKIPHINLAKRTPSPHTKNHFHTLLGRIHEEEFPTFWNMDHSGKVGNGSFGPDSDEECGHSSKSWESHVGCGLDHEPN